MNKEQQTQLQEELQAIKQLYEETLTLSKKDPEFYASIKDRLAQIRKLLLQCHTRYKEIVDEKGQQIKPTSTKNGPDIAGDPNGSKTVLVTWTFDDGPVPASKPFEQKLNIDHATWFIVRANMHKVDGWNANIQHYLRCQQEGGSIGIHAQHLTYDHILWFPDHTHPNKYKAYPSIEAAMNDMDAFYKELTTEKIYPKFVRPPGGLASQLQGYARHLGFVKDEPRLVRNALIAGKTLASIKSINPATKGRGNLSLQVHFTKMQKDLNTMKSRLKGLGLKLWGGTVDPNQLKAQSWNAASAGTLGMTDSVTKEVSHAERRKEKWVEQQLKRKGNKKTRTELIKEAQKWFKRYTGKFEKLVDAMKAGDEKPFIILAHDTAPHIDEIFEDKKIMEAYAAKNDTKIVYLNMNELFDRVAKK